MKILMIWKIAFSTSKIDISCNWWNARSRFYHWKIKFYKRTKLLKNFKFKLLTLENHKKVKKTKRKIKSKTSKAASSFNLDEDFDEYSGRPSSGSNRSFSSRRMSSPLAATRKRVTAASPEVDENMKKSFNFQKKVAAIKIEAYEPPAASTAMVSSQPTKDQMLAEIDNLLSDDSDSD